MKILNHKLEGLFSGPSPNSAAGLVNPSILVMHFTASGGPTGKGDLGWFMDPRAKASAHIIAGRDGKITQPVAFNRKAYHAGRSIWRGVPNCNDYSIGIEIDNWGKLTKTADGKFRGWTGEEVPANRVTLARHKHEDRDIYWEIYTKAQLDAVEEVTRIILAKYPSIKEIVGHDDISPGRKTDPGPLFPISRFRSLVNGRGNKSTVNRRTTANLNERGGPGTKFDIIRTISKNAVVTVVYDAPGEWAQLDTGGWVNDRYLGPAL